jgi:hypothetical protein
MARDGGSCRSGRDWGFSWGLRSTFWGEGDPSENGGPAEGRKRAVLVCIALQLHICSPVGHAD